MKKEHVIFEEEVHDEKSIVGYIQCEVLPYVPYWDMQTLTRECDIRIRRYGFVHDYGFYVVLIAHDEDRSGTGWSDIEETYRKERNLAKRQWELAIEYSYRID